MSKSVLLVMVLVACGGDGESIHDELECDAASWNPVVVPTNRCERACVTKPANFSGSASMDPCGAMSSDGQLTTLCERTFEAEGTRGCCIVSDQARFFECQ